VGRLVPKKGFDILVRAAAKLAPEFPRLRFVVGGGGPQEGELRGLAAGLDVADRFVFPGVIPHSTMPGFLSAADVLAVPSVVDSEGNMDGLPNVVLESLAAGRAVVASRLGGIPLAIRDGTDGVLVTPGSSDELAAALAALLRDPDRRSALARSGRERAANDLSWDSVAAGYERLFRAIV
jgi:glycosyltransferase involved in cell wall biosynthesis